MRANALMKANVDAVLKARGITREELSKWCRREASWASKILTNDKRWFPMAYWDKLADFLGLAPYQLMQPGISSLTERRQRQRRSGSDRRLSAANHHVRESVSGVVANLSAADVADLIRWKTLTEESRAVLRDAMQAAARSERQSVGRGRRSPAAGTAVTRTTGRGAPGGRAHSGKTDG